MKSRVASARATDGLDRVDRAVQMLEEEWRRHGEVQLERFWADERRALAPDANGGLALLVGLIKADLRRRFDRGETPTINSYLERFPELRTTDDRVVSLVYEEFCLSEERGHAPDIEAFCARYPDWKSSLISQLQYHRLFSEAAGVKRPVMPVFPNPGDDFEGFHLVSLLGTGGTSRAFLASDRKLGGKRVVLKITLDRGHEPQVQGPLNHPHIVPLNSVTHQVGGNLCGLAMPFQPGLPLDEIIAEIKPAAARPRKAMELWRVLLERFQAKAASQDLAGLDLADEAALGPRGDGWAGFPVRGTYPQAVAWLGMIIARALHYAHARQTFHRDVKPANVLLTFDRGPQLLDFNLADSPHAADHAHAALHGGTVPYMAPEQIEAFLNPDLWDKVGAKADVYSLGLVLRELLTGQTPEAPDRDLPASRALRSLLDRRPDTDLKLRRHNPSVPYALQAIVAKCLTFKASRRYSDAASLADDLEAFLQHAPLRHAHNPSRRERLANWSRRNRATIAAAAFAFVLGVAVRGPVGERLKPDVETLAKFQNAVKAVNSKEYYPAIRSLRDLEKTYPESSLVKVYLSIALDECGQKRGKADELLGAAFNSSDAQRSLVAWAETHPELPKYLIKRAAERSRYVDQLAEFDDERSAAAVAPVDGLGQDISGLGSALNDDESESEERDQFIRMPTYKLLRDMLYIVERAEPDSQRIQRLLARAEGLCGDYERAYERIDQLFNSIKGDGLASQEMLFFCNATRARIATLWTETLLKQGAPVDDRTVAFMQGAVSVLAKCRSFLSDSVFSEDQRQKVMYMLRDHTRAVLTLAEVEIDRNMLTDAEKNLRKAQRFLREFNDLADQVDRELSSKRQPQKVRRPSYLSQRLSAGRERLRSLQSSRPQTAVPAAQETNGVRRES